jgi:DNA replication and repair protein RecF
VESLVTNDTAETIAYDRDDNDAAAPASVSLRKLALTDFRCYARASLACDSRIVVLTGPNGAGKTNLLEAISFLAPGRGIRRAKLDEIDRRADDAAAAPAAGGWAVAATVDTPYGPVDIGTGRDPQDTRRRRIRINGATASSQTALGDYVSAVWLTPQMDRIFIDGAAARRRFFDRLIYGFDPAHAGRINSYNHAMRERLRLLSNGKGDDTWLGSLEQSMAERGIAIAAARREMAARLDKAARIETHAGSGAFPSAAIAATGILESWLDEAPAAEAEQRFCDLLRRNRSADAESGKTAAGPHRGDFAVIHRQKNAPADQCSTGEQKALLIAIVLADARLQAAERGLTPLLLLDEVAAHLDERRRHALFEDIAALGAQVWLTGTDTALFAPLGGTAQFVAVAHAALQAETPEFDSIRRN